VTELDSILISALNHYDYCPRRCYLIYVMGEFLDNPYTVEGELLHEAAPRMRTKRGELLQIRRVHIYSHRYNLIGFADLVEEKAGKLYPVEYKRGRKGNWKNDQLQLCAQALCLEEMTGRKIAHGYIYYAASQQRKEVEFSKELRAYTLKTIEKVKRLLRGEFKPEAIYTKRCRGCSLYPICLPKEAERLKTLKLEME
jgi:CRISPR-associated exonuclease Cas4